MSCSIFDTFCYFAYLRVHHRGGGGIELFDTFVQKASLIFLKVFRKRPFVGSFPSRRYRLSLIWTMYTGAAVVILGVGIAVLPWKS